MSRRFLRAATALVALVLAAACSSGEAPTPSAAGSPPDIASLLPRASQLASPLGSGSPAPGASVPLSPAPTTVGPSPAPIDPGFESTLPVEATITPACVVRGGEATITIRTEPQAAVAYHAVYAGTKGGANPPFGSGYGGDDRGRANGEGVFTDTWTVRADAPVGPARADVVVSSPEEWGYDDPPFYVGASPSGCPA